ncbi:MAG TPA: type II toxin-antitoxin system RelE/ParE family toxin [Tepidisphaeraceae bacterium]
MSRPWHFRHRTAQARLDLLNIWNYIAERNFDAADKVRDELYDAFGRLADMPGLGHTREDLADKRHRFWSVPPDVIMYRPETRPLQIVMIVHGARDLRALLGHDE